MTRHSSTKPRISPRPFEVTIPTADGSAVADRITINVPMEWDSDINEWTLTAEAEELIETTKARHMGLLLPGDLRALRLRHGLSQKAIGDLLQIGAKSWTRWETGKQRPSRSINLLLCAIHNGLISPQQLSDLGTPKRDWSAQFVENEKAGPAADPVVIDFYRANQSVTARTDYAEPMEIAL